MPFDGKPPSLAVQALDKAMARLRDEALWCHRGPRDGAATCLVVTVKNAINVEQRERMTREQLRALNDAMGALNSVVVDLYPERIKHRWGLTPAARFNDHAATVHGDVLRVLARTREIVAREAEHAV